MNAAFAKAHLGSDRELEKVLDHTIKPGLEKLPQKRAALEAELQELVQAFTFTYLPRIKNRYQNSR
jgi:hypothetical protein